MTTETLDELGGGRDEALLARVRGGDAGAFGGLVRGVAVRTLGPQEARDARQDVWLRVWLSAEKSRGDRSFSTWLYRVAFSTCLTEYRRAERRRFVEAGGRQGGPIAPVTGGDGGGGDPGLVLAKKERRGEALSGARAVALAAVK